MESSTSFFLRTIDFESWEKAISSKSLGTIEWRFFTWIISRLRLKDIFSSLYCSNGLNVIVFVQSSQTGSAVLHESRNTQSHSVVGDGSASANSFVPCVLLTKCATCPRW